MTVGFGEKATGRVEWSVALESDCLAPPRSRVVILTKVIWPLSVPVSSGDDSTWCEVK